MQGFNMGRYYPPDAENPPRFNANSHPLGQRAKKINQGILTVRFELPFAVWCQHCKPEAIVGQGVRFNAEKKRVGNYHSTPIWSFRMKHTACGGIWEIRTDPKNAEYTVVEGARRRDYGPEEKEARAEMGFLTEEERDKRRNDAFAGLEGRMEEQGLQKKQKERVDELYEAALAWEDSYTANAKLRKVFRVQRKALEKEQEYKESMQDRFSLGMEIADEVESDHLRAKLVDFGVKDGGENEAARKPLFSGEQSSANKKLATPRTNKLKRELNMEKTRLELRQTLLGNTRAAINPFSSDGSTLSRASTKPQISFKRKRGDDAPASFPASTSPPTVHDVPSTTPKSHRTGPASLCSADTLPQSANTQAVLVGYESD